MTLKSLYIRSYASLSYNFVWLKLNKRISHLIHSFNRKEFPIWRQSVLLTGDFDDGMTGCLQVSMTINNKANLVVAYFNFNRSVLIYLKHIMLTISGSDCPCSVHFINSIRSGQVCPGHSWCMIYGIITRCDQDISRQGTWAQPTLLKRHVYCYY